MSTVQEIESAIRRLSADEMREVRDLLEGLLEGQRARTPEFESKIARSGQEMKADPERTAWLQASAEKLTAAWSSEDDVFNELLQK